MSENSGMSVEKDDVSNDDGISVSSGTSAEDDNISCDEDMSSGSNMSAEDVDVQMLDNAHNDDEEMKTTKTGGDGNNDSSSESTDDITYDAPIHQRSINNMEIDGQAFLIINPLKPPLK